MRSIDIAQTVLPDIFPSKPSKAQRTQMQIIEAALHCYGKYGIEATDYERIAKRAKVSRPLVQHYFPKNEVLVRTVMTFIRGRFQKYCVDAILAETDPEAQLKAYLEATFEWIKKFKSDASVWFLFYYYCSFDKAYRKLNTDLVSQGQTRIAGLIRQGIAAKVFRGAKDSEIEKRAKLLQNALTGGLVNAGTEDKMLSFNPSEDVIRHCLEIARGL